MPTLPVQTNMPAAIDFERFFLPEAFTPLYHVPSYADLTRQQQRRYNQLYALYFNEQITFLETALAENVLLPLARSGLPESLVGALETFVEEESRHTRMFRALNRRCAPDLYAARDFHFIRVQPVQQHALGWIARQTRRFPFVLWLMLLQEERSMFYGRAILREHDRLEPHFVEVHRVHLADEADHVRWDEELLDHIWDACPPVQRRISAELFRWLVGEFFNTPRRGGLRVLAQLAEEFDELAPRLPELRRQVLDLARSPAYHRSLYSRDIVPRTFARFDRHTEFSRLDRTLYGYDRRAPARA
jgi:P-aminobenzoate N-oxygenase AurF